MLNVAGYYDALMSLAAHAVGEGFLQASYRESGIVEENPQQLRSQLGTTALPVEEKWVTTKSGEYRSISLQRYFTTQSRRRRIAS